jgi:hypothetical protein
MVIPAAAMPDAARKDLRFNLMLLIAVLLSFLIVRNARKPPLPLFGSMETFDVIHRRRFRMDWPR